MCAFPFDGHGSAALDEKMDRIGRIKAVLRSSLRDQDDIIVGAIRSLIELGNECYRRREASGGPSLKRQRGESDGEEAEADNMSRGSKSGVRWSEHVFGAGRGEMCG